MVDMETELKVLLLDHRLRDVHKVLNSIHDGECQGTELQFPALHLGNIQDIVDQSKKMIACKTDLTETFSRGINISEILPGYGRKTYDRIHRGPDIM